ncbi:MAG: prepilin-type N-terminal cleavage/methylation domain-containing protein [PVC group bacterium]
MPAKPSARVFALKAECGFTVIEILIAVALGAVILATVYGAYHMVVKTTMNYSSVSDTYQTARIVLDTLAKEISGAYQPLFAKKGKMFLGVDEWYAGLENDTLSMVTTTCIRGGEVETGHDTYEVSYYLGRGEDDGLLYMKMAPYFSLEEPFGEGEEVVMAENVRSLDFKYFDGTEWVETWGGEEPSAGDEEAPALPYGVRITVSLGPPGEKAPARFSTVAYLPMTPRLKEEEEIIEE